MMNHKSCINKGGGNKVFQKDIILREIYLNIIAIVCEKLSIKFYNLTTDILQIGQLLKIPR